MSTDNEQAPYCSPCQSYHPISQPCFSVATAPHDIDEAFKGVSFSTPVTAPVSTREQPETGWLLEKMHNGNVHYVSADHVLTWTDDPNKALRLARREDAEALCTIVEDCEKIASHEWVPAATSTTPVDGEQEPDIYDAVAEFRDRAGIDQVVANDPALRVAFETQRPKSHAATPPPVVAAQVQCADCLAWINRDANHNCRQQVRRNQGSTRK